MKVYRCLCVHCQEKFKSFGPRGRICPKCAGSPSATHRSWRRQRDYERVMHNDRIRRMQESQDYMIAARREATARGCMLTTVLQDWARAK